MEEEDISALLGKNLDLTELTSSITKVPKEELSKIEPDQLENKLINEHNEVLEGVKSALADVLMQVQTTPNDGDLVDGAAKLVNSYSGLLNGLHKIYSMREKFKQQLEIQKLKILADDKINQDNNQTKILLSREQIMKTIGKNTNQKIIDVTPTPEEKSE